MKTTLLLTLFLLPITATLIAQPSVRPLHQYMAAVRQGSYAPAPAAIFQDESNASTLINAAATYTTDSVSRIRSKAYNIVKQIALNSRSVNARQKAVGLLIDGISDTDTGLSGNASESLYRFDKTDFTDDAKNALNAKLVSTTPHVQQVIQLVGYLEIASAKAILNQLLATDKRFSVRWAVWLALARMGDQNAIDYLSRKIARASINDDFVYEIAPDLVYTRQKALFQFLENIIASDSRDCHSANPDSNAEILCGYRVMEYIAPTIEDYPLPVDEFGNVEIDDYRQALQEVRAWLVINPDYVILKNAF